MSVPRSRVDRSHPGSAPDEFDPGDLSGFLQKAQFGVSARPQAVPTAPQSTQLAETERPCPRCAGEGAPHLIVAGSSQRMMQGLVMDRSAPLFGRASEILKIRPLAAGWITTALEIERAHDAVEAFAMWGGVPRHWKLAADYPDLPSAVISLVLDPLGVLHDEPGRLLLDDLRDTTQAGSILSLIGSWFSKRAGRLMFRLGQLRVVPLGQDSAARRLRNPRIIPGWIKLTGIGHPESRGCCQATVKGQSLGTSSVSILFANQGVRKFFRWNTLDSD